MSISSDIEAWLRHGRDALHLLPARPPGWRGHGHEEPPFRRVLPGLAAAIVLAGIGLLQPAPAQAQAEDASQSQGQGQAAPSGPPVLPARETSCSDGKDEDGDTVFDCGDADCFTDPVCKPDGGAENTEGRCSDWIDNDGDDSTDCDDSDCLLMGVTVCKGSAQVTPSAAAQGQVTVQPGVAASADDLPQLGPGMQVEDLIGKAGDIDGERNDVLCSDGVDNDGDGRIDCQDFGCRFDREVTVCQGSPDFRFSVVARVEQFMTFKDTALEEQALRNAGGQPVDMDYPVSDSRFTLLQLRAFGPLPFVDNSFYLLSMRAERTPRLTFAMFQLPIGKRGDYLNINSGGGGISNALVLSAHKRLLLDPPFYVYNAFEQGNGAAAEVGGPIDEKGKLRYRAFVAGGSGRFTGNVGGRFVVGGDENFNYSVGGQLHYNVLGYSSRWDTPLLYTPAATALGVELGFKYDQRSAERFPALNLSAVFRHQRVIALAEFYGKRDVDFGVYEYAYNLQVGVLVIPKKLLVAADFGEFLVNTPDDKDLTGFALPQQESQARLAVHYFLWRNVFLATLIYTEHCLDREMPVAGVTSDSAFPFCHEGDELDREARLAATYRF